MSNLVIFYFNNVYDYDYYKDLSEKIIKVALKNKRGVIFNFEGYAEELIKQLGDVFYFSVSDDFLQLNSEFITQEISLDSDEKNLKNKYSQSMKVFDEITLLLKKNGINKFDLLIDTNEANSMSDFIIIDNSMVKISDTMYEYLTNNQNHYPFEWASVLIHSKL